jgi:uncharacterized repeat protein (TIGR03803 family)
MAHAQAFNVLYDFGSHVGDPRNPGGAIAQGRDGSLYGTSDVYDNMIDTDVFKITPYQGKLTTLATVSEAGGGVVPFTGGLTLGTDGSFYGATPDGGSHSAGTIFKVAPGGGATTLYEFLGGADGAYPTAQPVQGLDGNFYGTTYSGGSGMNCDSPGCGTVYRITPSGTHTVLHNFDYWADGQSPYAPLMQAIDGNFYGATIAGGPKQMGTIFKISPSGRFEVVFNSVSTDWVYPGQAALVQGNDGVIYGTSMLGGLGAGTVFKIVHGTVTVLHDFTGASDGGAPVGLVQGTDGNLYGTTTAYNYTIFRVSPSGSSFNTLYVIPTSAGIFPNSTLLQHTNGLLYGTTIYGGSGNSGILFTFDAGLPAFVTFLPAARQVGHTLEILGQGLTGTTAVSFNGTPAATFNVLSNTYMTATVPNGATSGFITVTTPSGTLTSNKPFQVNPQITSFNPTSGAVGTSVVITGVSLSQTSKITFNSVVATSFTVDSDTQVTVTVPAGATGAKIGLTTTGAPVYSASAFTVTQ